MKRNTKILIKTTALVLAFMLLLGVGIMSLSFSHSGVKPNDSNFLTPDLAITAPTSQELLQKKFNAYNTITEENGKSVVTIFSEEQITDFNDRRDNGEWFWLSSEEMLYLINDTVRLFEEYDVVRIWGLGKTMQEFDCLNPAMFAYDVIIERVRVLNSATYLIFESDETHNYAAYTDIKTPLTEHETVYLSRLVNSWQSTDKFMAESILVWSFCNTAKGKNIYTWDCSILSRYEIFAGEEFWEQRITIYPLK